MVLYIGINSIRKIVETIGLDEFIERLAGEIEADYRRWPEFENSPRFACHTSAGVMELMPACDGRLYSFKYVTFHPGNISEGLLTVTAFGVLADVMTGYPLLLSEMTVATALRTAAMSALAGKALARPGSRVMALIGNGAQSEFQAIAFHRMLGIREVRVFDIDPTATAKLERNLRTLSWLDDLQITHTSSAAEACRSADIVTTLTANRRNAVVLTPEMIRPGMHVNALGGDCPGKTELHADILRIPGARVVVEHGAQSRFEGEVQQMGAEYPVVEFADIASGKVPGRTSSEEVTIFDSVGFALEDFSTLRYLHTLVKAEESLRSELDLVPALENPKDLFGGTLGGIRTRFHKTG